MRKLYIYPNMAQLPPKVPSIIPQHQHHHHHQQWQEFMYPQQHDDQGQNQNPPWVDEFIEFSAAKRGVHRRSASESSVAFVEAGITGRNDDDDNSNKNNNNKEEEFDKFDDEQFLSMFSNELGGGSTSTSEHNSTNEDQRKETATATTRSEVRGRDKVEEVESKCKADKDNQGQVQGGCGGGCGGGGGGGEGSHNDIGCSGNNIAAVSAGGNNTGDVDHDQLQPVVDPKRVKRILANRQSAQRSRVRKLQYISELERSVTALQSEVSALSPRVAFLDHQRMILNVDNSNLKAKIAALAQDKIFKDAHQEAMKREIERLRHVYYQQNLNKPERIIPPSSASSLVPTTAQPPPPDTAVNENEQLAG